MTVANALCALFLAAGVLFYIAGTIGLLRFPDIPSRLHALTKADNLGLGFIALSAAIHWGSPAAAAKLFLIWLIALFSAGAAAQLIAREALDRERGR